MHGQNHIKSSSKFEVMNRTVTSIPRI